MKQRKIHRYSMIRRYGKIVDALIKYEFGYIVDRMGLRNLRPLRSRIRRQEKVLKDTDTGPMKARMMLEELGPTYIKLGQILSMRQDLIPPEYANEFSKLQDDVQPFEMNEVEKLIRAELGSEIKDIYQYFEPVPIAAASIGQVHRAKLISGEDVVVKVQRPGIRKIINSDLDIMYSIASFAEEHLPEAKLYQPVGIVEEFERTIKAEMDYTQEGRNADHFARNFRDDPRIYIPKVYWDCTSAKVLTLEFIDGVKSSNFKELDRMEVDRREIGIDVLKAFMKQIYDDGFFHADLHPGNIFIMKDSRIALLDFGMAGFLSQDMRNLLIDDLIALTRGDTVLYIELLRELGSIDENTDLSALKIDIDQLIYKYYGRPLGQLDTALILEEMINLLRKYQVRVPSNVALLSKGAMTAESFGSLMDRDINLTIIAEPFAKKAIKDRLRLTNIAGSTFRDASNWARVLHKAPIQIGHILDIAERGYLKLRFDPQGFDRVVSEIDAASNRLSFSLIISAIIVGSSFIIQTGMEPHIWGVPLLGVIGFLMAGFLGMWLVVYILRTGRI
ncbi:MAG: ubiquinone biosynthesis protein [Methanolobus sp.]|jgi:ubiquinone biosynthesis protein|uniref:Putative unusual protein kinase n=1 Tax=Methanolobus tindarius DSM 2278 TaxID=1090322 RepID=W9DXN1_METTI|nr:MULTISPECIES: AarF/ABC1/UbiB kinase family protein [Methanolobus]ETA68467.1 putative unusual protein kinase [Methanolobus tindarius DSM 2278]MDK2832413.1 ubiquinone biosynthesis protein [Methanolobus sp.]MDK2938468.1 ubiquinone biosynthesis protein [Methanolobus sp.]